MSILKLKKRDVRVKPLIMLTCYDYSLASILNTSSVDLILVGDTCSMVVHGHNTTIPATMEMMELHTQSVARGAPDKIIVGDLPFMSYRKGISQSLENIERLVRAGACVVKLEGYGNEELVRHAVLSGVPMIAHLGLTPQEYHALGGFRVQGKKPKDAARILEAAHSYAEAGASALVLECVPHHLAQEITESISIPTIGIGAGPHVDGQVLVSTDLLGLTAGSIPKFSRQYLDGKKLFADAVESYCQDVIAESFPTLEESYVYATH